MSNEKIEKKKTNSKRDLKKNTKLKSAKSLKLVNRVMRIGQACKREK